MRFNDENKHDHSKWEKENSESQVKSSWRKAMRSIHNKISRGAEYLFKMIPYGRNEGWRRNHGHNDDKKKQ